MQNDIQNDQPTTDARATLAEMLAERAEEIAEWERDQAQREQRAREQERAEALASADTFLQQHIRPPLANILRITPAVDESLLQPNHDDDDDYRPNAGYLILTLRGAGVDDGEEEEAGDPSRAHRWLLRHEYVRYHGWRWILRGPHGYAAQMPGLYSSDACIDAGLLDAIAAYPAWLEAADERAEAERRKREEQQAEQERTRRGKQVRHYDAITSYGINDPGLLSAGHHLLVLTRDPREEDGMMERRGVLETWTDAWLLLNLDGHERGTLGAQRLIPIASVIEIQPLPDVEQEDRQEAQA